jgi:hypothetical protein
MFIIGNRRLINKLIFKLMKVHGVNVKNAAIFLTKTRSQKNSI